MSSQTSHKDMIKTITQVFGGTIQPARNGIKNTLVHGINDDKNPCWANQHKPPATVAGAAPGVGEMSEHRATGTEDTAWLRF